MNKILWQPDIARQQNSQLWQFMQWLQQERGLHFPDYAALHQWSVTPGSTFWRDCARFLGLRARHWGSEDVNRELPLWQQHWFADSRINYAENLLTFRDDRIALHQVDESGEQQHISYAELQQQVASVSTWLMQQGMRPGERVAAVASNRIETVVAMLACTSLGLVWTSCSADFGEKALHERFSQTQPRILFAVATHIYAGKTHQHPKRLQALADKLPALKALVWLPSAGEDSSAPTQLTRQSGDPLPCIPWSGLLQQPGETLLFADTDFNHPLFVLYSSGTTGAPKGIVHGHGGTLLQHRKEHALHVDLKREDVLLYYTSCGWMMWNWLVSALASGCTVVLCDGSPLHPEPTRLFDLVDKLGVTVLGVSASYLSAVHKADLAPRYSHRLQHLRCLLSTGSPLLPEGFDFVYERIKPDLALQSISGGTDIISCFVLGNPLLAVRRGEIQCAGLGMDVAVLNNEGHEVVAEKGELVCRQPFPSMPVAFWNDADGERYRKAYFSRFLARYPQGIWTHGDYAELSESGGYVIHGRSDTVLNPGGVRIGTAEIYRVIEQMSEILEAVAVGQRINGDERILLFIRLANGFALDEILLRTLRQAIRDGASPRHVPALILPVQDIPRTLSGKIAETAVRDTINGETVGNRDALANPESLAEYQQWRERLVRESQSR